MKNLLLKNHFQSVSYLLFIDALPEESARLLKAIDIEGESQREYAERVGIKYSTLKSQVKKGRGELRNAFEKCCKLSLDSSGGAD